MTEKEQIIIDINNCKYRDKYTNFCLAEKDEIGETYTICTGTDCYFKQLARETQERDRYRKVFDEIEEIVNIDFSLPCARTDCTYPKPCKDSLTENGTKCMRFALLRIKDIVQKNKEK